MIEKRRMEQSGIYGTLWRATSVGRSHHTYFTHPVWLPDSSGLIFLSDRAGSAGCYLLEWPSGRITPIAMGGITSPVVSSDGESMLYVSNRCILRRDISSEDREVISQIPDEAIHCGQIGQTCDGRYLTVCCTGERYSLLVKAPRKGGHATIFHRDHRHLSHLIPSTAHAALLSVAWTHWAGGETNQRLWIVAINGKEMRPLYHQKNGELVTHEAWSGDGRIAFTSGPFDRKPNTFSVKSVDPLTERTQMLAERGNFWHCCPNRDCSMVVADTNWPDDGIKLIDVPESDMKTLCYSNSSTAIHPHPCFSPDGRKVVYTSDLSGSPQIYVAELP